MQQALDVLDDDDRVIDQQADRQRQPEQGQRVDGEPGHVENRERPQKDDRDRDRRHQQGAPVLQEDEDDEDDEDDRLDQRLHDLFDGQLDEVGRVVCVAELQPFRKILRKLLDASLDQVGGLQCVGAGCERNSDARAGMAVDAHDRE